MFNIKYFFRNISIAILLIILTSCKSQRLSHELLGGWNEKELTEQEPDYLLTLQSVETYISEQGYSLDETDIIPFGFFKQIVNGINYRILFAVKEKTSNVPTIYDINYHKAKSEMKMIYAKNPENSGKKLSDKDKKKLENAIIKFYFEKLYKVKEVEIQYEYHNFDGLNKYGVYDVVAQLENEKENFSKRMLVVYRNDKTFEERPLNRSDRTWFSSASPA